MLELNYRLRSRAASASDPDGAQALAVGVNARVHDWLEEQTQPTRASDAAIDEPDRPLASSVAPAPMSAFGLESND
jgi:hypothetical protein